MAHPTARKWVITPVISGLTLLIPFITGVITHLLSGMSHQVQTNPNSSFGMGISNRSPAKNLSFLAGYLADWHYYGLICGLLITILYIFPGFPRFPMVSSHVFPEVIGFYFYNLVVNDGSACFMQVVRREPGFGGRHINHLSDVELQLCDLVVGSQIVTEGDLPKKKGWVLT